MLQLLLIAPGMQGHLTAVKIAGEQETWSSLTWQGEGAVTWKQLRLSGCYWQLT